ncbi:MAG TPA: hypothetical protein VG756_05975 [Pseudonocardiaceae bacterium]|jgi:hypothetical protein|nr:hypothetical protein [Pseudonocardiaceae bacterium]
MEGRFWSFLLRLQPPIQRELQRERNRADEAERQADCRIREARERHGQALGQAVQQQRDFGQRWRTAEQNLARLRLRLAERQQRADNLELINHRLDAENSGLDEENRRLHTRLAAARETEQRRHEQETAEARSTTTDLFCCQECLSFWLLSVRPAHNCTEYTVLGPIGPGTACAGCTDGTQPMRLTEVITDIAERDEIEGVARPADEAPEPAEDIPVPGGDRVTRTDIGARFVADLLQRDPGGAIDETAVHELGTPVRDGLDRIAPPTRCAGLAAIADGLDRVPTAIHDGIAWYATEILGAPQFLADVLGVAVRRVAGVELAPLQALHIVAQGIRAAGVLCCAADGQLGRCRCARHFIGDPGEMDLPTEFRQFLDRGIASPADITEPAGTPEAPEPPAPPAPPDDEFPPRPPPLPGGI